MSHLDSIRTFLRVAELENFSETARQLGVPKSLVTRRIKALEDALGTPLLVRTTRRVRLTEAGALYRQHVAGLVEELDSLESSISGSALNLRGLMRISSPTAFGIQALRPALASFLRQHPELTFELVLNDQPVNPAEEGYDVVITDRGAVSGQFQEEPLLRFDLVCCAAPGYLAEHGTPAEPADLRQHEVIQYLYNDSGLEWRFMRGEETFRVLVHPRLSTNSGAVMRDAALDGEGITLLPYFLAREDLASGRLVEVLPGYGLPQKIMKAVLPRRRETVRRSQQLIQYLREALASTCPERGALREPG
ncbi:MAG: LysR family transcriptional regulator [Chiayiivirga sp.]|jgi:DNA-binding transcriptional LysR family regulator|uniref:LysR family transcriptional regulator n=1 Tax=Denitratimonas tolerans TaxID=1338420 RepID=A0AAW9R737_9GAMM|nr:LysR family transcriptional regulator [Chiayiivirga sp.]MEB2315074.1 LysR family transcriptional regulator [Xanthomonadaceae bacterium]HMN35714.1 LysR family transcriptional regulator [Chiayiivirga sp.]HRQ35563.1 LysR family transcriptional regulator [Chiayiivirga sp.]